jgi:hypothetical protein
MHLYTVGTAAKLVDKPVPDKALEQISYDNITLTNACPPSTYDVLLNFGGGKKYEWRKNIVIQTGLRTDVK